MLQYAEYVKLEGKDDKVYFYMSGIYPHELFIYIKPNDIKRLGDFFVSLSKGKKNKKWAAKAKDNTHSFTFRITAEECYGTTMPCLHFHYSYYNIILDGMSVSFTRYDAFDSEALLDFGLELLDFNVTKKAILCDRSIRGMI